MLTVSRAWVLLLIFVFQPIVVAAKDRAERCVADICLKSTSKSVNWLLNEYGRGHTHKDDNDGEIALHCYYDAPQKLWIELEISKSSIGKSSAQLTGVFVTSVSLCPKKFAPKRPFPRLQSMRGVGIGASESVIVAKLGDPNRRDEVTQIESKSPYLKGSLRYSSMVGSQRLVYDDAPDSLLFNFYGLERGVLVSMWFAERE